MTMKSFVCLLPKALSFKDNGIGLKAWKFQELQDSQSFKEDSLARTMNSFGCQVSQSHMQSYKDLMQQKVTKGFYCTIQSKTQIASTHNHEPLNSNLLKEFHGLFKEQDLSVLLRRTHQDCEILCVPFAKSLKDNEIV